MTSRPLDTTATAWSMYQGALDRMGGPARVRAAIELSEAIREIRLAGIMARHPQLSRRQAIARVIAEEYGVELPVPE